jgi:hypothetical protein
MIAGIILGSLGLKKVLEYVADTSHHELSDPLATLPLWALYGGTAFYLLAHVAFRFRIWHHVSWHRVAAAAVVLVSIPFAAVMPALGALGLLTVVLAGLIAYEAITRSEFRERVRHEDDAAGSPPTPER